MREKTENVVILKAILNIIRQIFSLIWRIYSIDLTERLQFLR